VDNRRPRRREFREAVRALNDGPAVALKKCATDPCSAEKFSLRACAAPSYDSARVNVLFVCSDNSVLSIMAESILRGLSARRFEAFSAGCLPRGAVDGYALELLSAHRLPVSGLHPKSLEGFRAGGTATMDFIITLCDLAEAEIGSDWLGEPLVAHWKVWDRDAAALASPQAATRDAFWTLRRRIQIFVDLQHRKPSRQALHRRALTLEPSHL
jgi:arsenate reductase